MYVSFWPKAGAAADIWPGCGTADKKLSSNARVERSMTRLVGLGNESAPGCKSSILILSYAILTLSATLQMLNKAGQPVFTPKTALTADAGSFAIESGNNLSEGEKFVFGYGAVDNEGVLRPLITVGLQDTDYYLALTRNRPMLLLTQQ